MNSKISGTIVVIVVAIAAQGRAWGQLPDPGFVIDPARTALVVTDPQIDFLSPNGVTWDVVGKSVTENDTVENLGAMFKTAKECGIQVFVSPHYYYKHDHDWKFQGAGESLMHALGMFDRSGELSLDGFTGSGADWLESYRIYIEDGETVVASPHKVFGPETNDLVLQLRKHGIDKVLLAGMSANLCIESHMRELVEQGFEVSVVSDATAGPVVPGFDGYAAALVNFRMIASHVWKTADAVRAMRASSELSANSDRVLYKTEKVGGLDIFYREAGPKDAPVVLLLHGFPTSSQMFRGLIPALADRYHVIAPDYPGFGHSSMPSRDAFAYTFDNVASVIDDFTEQLGLAQYAMYVQDYGAPIGYRLACAHPERITGIIVQNGNAYDKGIANDFWSPIKAYWKDPTSVERRNAIRNLLTYEATRWQYTDGAPDQALVSPDGAAQDQFLLDRAGNDEIQLDMFLSYGSNPPLYPEWQEYFRVHQPPMLIVWGKNDKIFPPAGAEPYKRDLEQLDFHLLDAGHFALETNGEEIASLMREFLGKHCIQD